MSEKDKAIQFVNSVRGQFIISQALVLALKEMRMRPKTFQEPSNMADMEFLLDNLFPLYKVVDESDRIAQLSGHVKPITDRCLEEFDAEPCDQCGYHTCICGENR